MSVDVCDRGSVDEDDQLCKVIMTVHRRWIIFCIVMRFLVRGFVD